MEIDWKGIMDEIGELASERLEYLVDSSKEDLKAYGKEIAKSMVIALRSGRQDLRDELLDQIEMLAEIHRIELNREAKAFMKDVLEISMRIGKAAIKVAL